MPDERRITIVPGKVVEDHVLVRTLPREKQGKLGSPTEVVFDSLGQQVKAIQLISIGPSIVWIWGSVDYDEQTGKGNWKYLGQVQLPDMGLHLVPRRLVERLVDFRFVKVERYRGAGVDVVFLAV